MPVKIAPQPRQQYFAANGDPLTGGKLFTYAAGTTTKLTTYTTSVGDVANTNPIILDSAGRTPSGVWLTNGLSYKFVLSASTDTDPPTSPIFTEDAVLGVNDTSAANSQWIGSGLIPTYINPTVFTLIGDQTTEFHVNRRVKLLVTAGIRYGTISASAYTTLTTITVVLDSGALDSGLNSVELGIITYVNSSIEKVAKAVLADNATNVTGGTVSATTGTFSGTVSVAPATAAGHAVQLGQSLLNATTALAAAYTVVAADRGKLFDCSGTFTLTLTAAATLGAGFSFAVRNSGTGVITLDPNLAELVNGVATLTYSADESSLVTCNGTAFKTVGKTSLGVFHIRDEKPSADFGGPSVVGDQARTLNTLVKNTIAGASATLVTDFTLPAGTYVIQASAPALIPARSRARLFNATSAVNTLLGTSEYSDASSVVVRSLVTGEFTITATSVFRLVHNITQAKLTDGLGVTSGDSLTNVYTNVFIEEVA